MVSTARVLFFAGVALVATGLLSPPLALLAGICLGMAGLHPFEREGRRASKLLLQASVVALGFGIDFGEVWRVGRASVVYTAVGIAASMSLGLLLGRLLQVRPGAAFLVSAGTAICGGSAIAALAPITRPDEDELAMSLGTVFTLNSVALLLFPAIGFALHMTQTQFGLWCALAIHDTSSVVGAAARFGSQALAVGTVVKLTRALWIVPVAMLTTVATARSGGAKDARVQVPWFILLFVLAALARTAFTAGTVWFGRLTQLGHVGLAITLFLIGAGISMRTIRQAGVRVMLQGVLLWIAAATISLALIMGGSIRL